MESFFLSIQVITSYPLYSTSPISFLSFPSEIGGGGGNKQ